jgi:hypothetical protein
MSTRVTCGEQASPTNALMASPGWRLMDLLFLRVSQINGCSYCAEEIELLPHGCKVANGYEYSPLSRSSLAGPSFQAEVRGHCRPSRCKTLIRSDAVHDRRYLS